jgi:hypothetical protein
MMLFLSRAQVVTAFGAVALALYVLDLVRRRRLSEEFSVLWVLATVVIAALGFSTSLLTKLTHALGILYEGSTVFAFGLAFALAMLLHLSTKLSRLTLEKDGLTREIAFLRLELEELRDAGGPAGTGEGR